MKDNLAELNTVAIHKITDPEFLRYGRILHSCSVDQTLKLLVENANIPAVGTHYEEQSEFFDIPQLREAVSDECFGGMAVEIGYCAGHNSKLNALEYHKCSEVSVFADDAVIAVGRAEDIDFENKNYDSKKAEFFYVPEGCQYELYPGTLHYGPMEVTPKGFRFVVCLLDDTNRTLRSPSEDPLLIGINKWVICHPEAADEVSKGVPVWISGDNTQIRYCED